MLQREKSYEILPVESMTWNIKRHFKRKIIIIIKILSLFIINEIEKNNLVSKPHLFCFLEVD